MTKKMSKEEKLVLSEIARRKRKKAYDTDFPLFCKELIKVNSKDPNKGFVPFNLNDAQKVIWGEMEKQLKETGKIRIIVLKARQQGISTFFAAFSVWMASRSANRFQVATISQNSETSESIVNMESNMIAWMPEWEKPELTKNSTKVGIEFAHNKSKITPYTALNKAVGRGLTPTGIHASEIAFWQYPEEISAGLRNGLPDAEGTFCAEESTANGATGYFYDQYQKAKKGLGEFRAVFVPWFLTKEYATKPEFIPKDFVLTEEEKEYQSRYDLTIEQMHWRRVKIEDKGLDIFQQEYPANDREAFLQTGSSVFDIEKLNDETPKNPIAQKEFDFATSMWEHHPQGSLQVFERHDHESRYVIGVDCSGGVGQDYSSATVMDTNGRVVAHYYNNNVTTADFGIICYYLGRDWNQAYMIVEDNNMGSAVLMKLREMNYSNLYHRKKPDGSRVDEPGFKTTSSTKPKIISILREMHDNDEIKLNSEYIIEDMKNFIANGSKMEASRGNHDDGVISTALAAFGLVEELENVKKQVKWQDAVQDFQKWSSVDSTNWL